MANMVLILASVESEWTLIHDNTIIKSHLEEHK